MKYFVGNRWVYFLKDNALHRTELDSVGFFETDRSIPVDYRDREGEEAREDQLRRIKSLLKPKNKLAQGGDHTGLFGV